MPEQCADLTREQSSVLRNSLWPAIALPFLLIAIPAQAAVYVTTGAVYSEFDDTNNTTELAVPVRVRKTGNNFSVAAGNYWLEGDGYSGIGDLVVAASLYDVFYSPSANIGLNLQGSIKFPTATDDIGSGEMDEQIGFSVYHLRENITWYGSSDYRFNGENSDYEYEDSLLLSVGFVAQPLTNTSIGVFYDYEQEQSDAAYSNSQLFLFAGTRLNNTVALRPFASFPLSNSSVSDASAFSIGLLIDVRLSR
ncbi:MAG: hypothetical protein P1U57_14060 [Oleibacter sp.]|nr:hypothetical protein [Thalassolituus sp.]